MTNKVNWAKAVPGQHEVMESHVESVIDSTREARRGRIERVVTLETTEGTFARMDYAARVNWRGHSFMVESVRIQSEVGFVGATGRDAVRGFVTFEVTLMGYREDRRPFDYWNAPLSSNRNPALWRITDRPS